MILTNRLLPLILRQSSSLTSEAVVASVAAGRLTARASSGNPQSALGGRDGAWGAARVRRARVAA